MGFLHTGVEKSNFSLCSYISRSAAHLELREAFVGACQSSSTARGSGHFSTHQPGNLAAGAGKQEKILGRVGEKARGGLPSRRSSAGLSSTTRLGALPASESRQRKTRLEAVVSGWYARNKSTEIIFG